MIAVLYSLYFLDLTSFLKQDRHATVKLFHHTIVIMFENIFRPTYMIVSWTVWDLTT